MPIINRIDILANEKKPNNWVSIIDKFLNNPQIQKSFMSIAENLKSKMQQTPQTNIPQQDNAENEKKTIFFFLE